MSRELPSRSHTEPWIMGVSASHNGAACLLKGRHIVAIQEERLTRHKRQRIHGARPSLAVEYCLRAGGITAADLSLVVLCCQAHSRSPDNDISQNPQFRVGSGAVRHVVISHHLGHAMSAFATSGLNESDILVVDGMGSPWDDLSDAERALVQSEGRDMWESISMYGGEGRRLRPLRKIFVPDAAWLTLVPCGMPRFQTLGGMYSAAAHQIFGHHMEAGKVMGLAAYGKPEIPVSEFFTVQDGEFHFSAEVCARFRDNARWPCREREYTVLAASVQEALEEALLSLASDLRQSSACRNLCLAGGVALNSLANERLAQESGYGDLYVFPAAEDSGPAVGAAYYGSWLLDVAESNCRLERDSFGRSYTRPDILRAISTVPGLSKIACNDSLSAAAEMLSAGKSLGWFQGGAELGPRALGHRSILLDPRRPDGQDFLNARIKHREWFRPFAPVCLRDEAHRWFDLPDGLRESPFMLRAVGVRPEIRSLIPAVVHVDGSARLQTLTEEANPLLFDLLQRFFAQTGVPLLLNTSLNISGEPLVETPADALWCVLVSGLDACVLEAILVGRKAGIGSMLDFYPALASKGEVFVRAERETARHPVGSIPFVAVNCHTPWGDFERYFTPALSAILAEVDGRKTARQILSSPLLAPEIRSNELERLRLLMELIHAGLLSLSEEPRTEL